MVNHVVTRQIARFGNLWRFCTSACEFRNARFKRQKVSWRPGLGAEVWGVYRRKVGTEVKEFKSRYNSSPMLQLLRNVACIEEMHADSKSVSSRRMQSTGRRSKMKLEPDIVPTPIGLGGDCVSFISLVHSSNCSTKARIDFLDCW